MAEAKQEPAAFDEDKLRETHGILEIAVMVDEDGSTVFGNPDDDLGELYEGEHGTTDQSKDRYVIQVAIPKAKTRNATGVIPTGATPEPKVIVQA